jgi:hypothetical protein
LSSTKSDEIKSWLKDPISKNKKITLPSEGNIVGIANTKGANYTRLDTESFYILRKNQNGYFIHTNYTTP